MSSMDTRSTAYDAYFFDLGGTLVAIEHDEIYRDETGHVTLLEGVQARLTALYGQKVFVITNQAGVALGYLTERTARECVEQVNNRLGGVITDFRRRC